MQESSQVRYSLDLLRDAFPPPTSTEAPMRMPTYTSLIVLHTLRGVFYPSNFVYPLTARFTLQRPVLDVTDIPMLYSNSDDWKKETGWIIRFLSEVQKTGGFLRGGIRGSSRVYFKVLMAFWEFWPISPIFLRRRCHYCSSLVS
jgi:hypothetical protein